MRRLIFYIVERDLYLGTIKAICERHIRQELFPGVELFKTYTEQAHARARRLLDVLGHTSPISIHRPPL